MSSPSDTQDLLDKIRALPEDKIAEVADFVEFLRLRAEEQRAAAVVNDGAMDEILTAFPFRDSDGGFIAPPPGQEVFSCP
jgi:hypothetical protein